MGQAKNIEVRPISQKDAAEVIKSLHYSGKVANTSQLHLGVFFQGKCHGAMQFGSPIDKSHVIGLVKNTHWNGFLELNRMAFADSLPKNSESRALGVAFRIIRKQYPHIKWILSFADGAQCGDGAIYRASGFVLTQIKKNTTMYRMPNGEVIANLSFSNGGPGGVRKRFGMRGDETLGAFFKRIGAAPLPGFQLRYIRFLNPADAKDLAVPIIPFSKIKEMGAEMYRGKAITQPSSQAAAESL
jgi:hypothetical protein